MIFAVGFRLGGFLKTFSFFVEDFMSAQLVKEVVSVLDDNGFGEIASAVSKKIENPKVAIQTAIDALQCCGEYQRWTSRHAREAIQQTVAPAARAIGIPSENFIFIL